MSCRGEMAKLIRDYDWSRTSLGPRECWPPSLCTVVDIMLANDFPMALLLGSELILIYNDAYRIICADKHPEALGHSTRGIWSEVWHINQPIFEAVMERGETFYFEDKLFPINRHGYPEDAYFNLCYSPVRIEGGNIGGTLVVLEETTKRKSVEEALHKSEKQQAFLLKLSDTLRPIADPVAIQEAASCMAAEHLNIGRVAYCEIQYDPDIVVVVDRDWPRRGMPSIAAGRYRMDDFRTFLAEELTAGRPVIIADAATDPRISRAQREQWGEFEIVANCSIPIIKEGRFVACLVAQDNRRHDWNDREIALLREVSERTWATVELARAKEELRRHGETLEELVKDRTAELEEKNRRLNEEMEKRKEVESQLLQAQKIDALDRFAGGIAHDMNNILSPMILNVEELLEGEPADSQKYDILAQTLKAAHRQRDLVKKILSFGRRSELALQPVRVKPILEETISFLRSSIPSTIDILFRVDARSDMVMGDPIQIQQVVMNLCQNAKDAFESGKGTIRVGLTSTHLKSLRSHPDLEPGDYLRLTVRDTGSGMKKDIMDRMFEPFFTTKGTGNGSGLGLSVVHGIVKNHRGAMSVKSTEGKGSLFTVYLPVCDEECQAGVCAADSLVPVRGKGKILLVDDEELILSSMKRALKASGYQVEALRDSFEALNVFKRKPHDFDMVITDLTMPGMTGVELARELTGICSDIPVILCTGFNDVISREEARSYGIRELIRKPAGSRELKEIIRKVLDN